MGSTSMAEIEERKKVIIVGDGNSGKTSLLWRIKNPDEENLPQFSPTVLELGAHRLENGTFIEFVDTAGQEDFKDVRVQTYHGADLFIILCTADSRYTLDNVREVWDKEVPKHKPRLLLMNKCDLEGESEGGVTLEALEKAGNEMGFKEFLRVSARSGENIPDLLTLIACYVEPEPNRC